MSEDKHFEIEEEQLEEAVGGKRIRRADTSPQASLRTRRAGGQRGEHIRRADDVDIHEA